MLKEEEDEDELIVIEKPDIIYEEQENQESPFKLNKSFNNEANNVDPKSRTEYNRSKKHRDILINDHEQVENVNSDYKNSDIAEPV